MAHEVETIAWANERPWHGLGVEVPADIGADELLVKAGLDWTADVHPLFYKLHGRDFGTTQRALVRSSDGMYLDVVGENWKPTQNRDALGFFRDFVDAGSMKMETAGSLRKGKHVFALAKITGDFEATRGDRILPYLLFSNPHMYGRSPSIMLTFIRVVCWNTITAALADGGRSRYSWSHLQAFDADRAEMAKEALGIAANNTKKKREEMQFMARSKAAKPEVEEYFHRLFDPDAKQKGKGKVARHVPKAMELLEAQPGAQLAEGTWWQAYNAVTFMTDHVLGKDQDARVSSAVFGGYNVLKNRAYDDALAAAKQSKGVR